MRIHENNALGEFGSAIGKGLLAGLAGTAAITLSQMIEMSITKRKASDAPVKVAEQTISVKPATEKDEAQLSNEIHWAYGTTWGVTRGLIGLTGLKDVPASLLHFAAVWGTSIIILPKFKVSPPITEQDPKAIAIDGLHHVVYALATGLAYDALDMGGVHERKLNQLSDNLKSLIKKMK